MYVLNLVRNFSLFVVSPHKYFLTQSCMNSPYLALIYVRDELIMPKASQRFLARAVGDTGP